MFPNNGTDVQQSVRNSCLAALTVGGQSSYVLKGLVKKFRECLFERVRFCPLGKTTAIAKDEKTRANTIHCTTASKCKFQPISQNEV